MLLQFDMYCLEHLITAHGAIFALLEPSDLSLIGQAYAGDPLDSS
jgi:hypothetical protein